MKLVDGMGIDAENMSSVNPQRSVHRGYGWLVFGAEG
jgi:hypothetical protein